MKDYQDLFRHFDRNLILSYKEVLKYIVSESKLLLVALTEAESPQRSEDLQQKAGRYFVECKSYRFKIILAIR